MDESRSPTALDQLKPPLGKVKAVMVFLLGAFLTWFNVGLVVSLIRQWNSIGWVFRIGIVVVEYMLLTAGLVLLLAPWRHKPSINRLARLAIAPADRIMYVVDYWSVFHWALAWFTCMWVVPVIGWKVLELEGLAPVVPEKAYNYVALVMASVIFTHCGSKLTARSSRKEKRDKFAKAFELLGPHHLRVLAYGMMAISYFAANLEKFSGRTLTTASWWVGYKDVLVEVLLTYTAIDAVLIAWNELRHRKPTDPNLR